MVRSKLLMEVILGVRKILIVFNIPYRIHSLTDWQRVSFYKDYGLAGHLSINIWSTDGTFGLLSTLRNLYKTMRNMMVHAGIRNHLQSQKEFLKDGQIYFWTTKKFHISMSVSFVKQIQWCHQNHLWTSIIILGIRKNLLIPPLKKTWRFDQPLWLPLVFKWTTSLYAYMFPPRN